MKHAHDDITVGNATLKYSSRRRGWLMPNGLLITNVFKAQRYAEWLNNKREAA